MNDNGIVERFRVYYLDMLQEHTVDELRRLLGQMRLSRSGRKADLIARVMQHNFGA